MKHKIFTDHKGHHYKVVNIKDGFFAFGIDTEEERVLYFRNADQLHEVLRCAGSSELRLATLEEELDYRIFEHMDRSAPISFEEFHPVGDALLSVIRAHDLNLSGMVQVFAMTVKFFSEQVFVEGDDIEPSDYEGMLEAAWRTTRYIMQNLERDPVSP